MEPIVAQIPTQFYVIVGGLIFMNFGTIVTIAVGVGRAIWFISKLESRVGTLETDHTKDLNAAFQRIRDIEQRQTKT